MNVALIGAGPWGRNYINTLQRLDCFNLKYVFSSNPETKELVPDGCVVSADWQELKNASNIDGVIVAATPFVHQGIAMKLIEWEFPCLVEKPLTLKKYDAIELHEFCAKSDGMVMVNYTNLYNPAYCTLKENLSQIGAIKKIEFVGGRIGPFREYSVLWDWGPHGLSMLFDILNTESAKCDLRVIQTEKDPDAAALGMTVELTSVIGSVEFRMEVSNIYPDRQRRLNVFADDKALIFDDIRSEKLQMLDVDSSGETIPGSEKNVNISDSNMMPLDRVLFEFKRRVLEGDRSGDDLLMEIGISEILEDCNQKLDSFSS